MTISEKLSHLKAINIEKWFDDILKDKEPEIINMAQSQMYDSGIMNVRTEKKEKYALSTVRAKRKAPFPKTEFITLKWFGDFHSSLKLLIFRDKFVISSDNLTWANYLETQSRFMSALGLTKKSKSELRDIVQNEIGKRMRNVI